MDFYFLINCSTSLYNGPIKDYREKELKMYIIANILMIVFLSNIFDFSNKAILIENEWLNFSIKLINSALMSSVIYIFAFLSDSLFSSAIKSNLLYLGRKLPGEKSFSNLKKSKDPRITLNLINNKYDEIYRNMPVGEKEKQAYQNACWYKIYSKYRNNPMIYIANRDYLLCRDMYISTIIIIIGYIVFSLLVHTFEFSCRCFFYLIFMLIITNVAANVKSVRFVFNTIVYDIHNQETDL